MTERELAAIAALTRIQAHGALSENEAHMIGVARGFFAAHALTADEGEQVRATIYPQSKEPPEGGSRSQRA